MVTPHAPHGRVWRYRILISVLVLVLLAAGSVGILRLRNAQPASYGAPGQYQVPAVGSDATSVERLETTLAVMGRSSISWNLSFRSIGKALNTELLDAAASHGVRHQIITLEFWDPSNHSNDSQFALRNIVRGNFDADMRRFAQQMQQWQLAHPDTELILRPLHEGNSDWYPWGFLNGNNGNTEVDYGLAWKHIHQVMRAEFAGLKFFWCPNGLFGGQTSYASWYPGDDLVDYVGHDKYNRSQGEGGFTWADPKQVHQASIEAVRKVSAKPYIIGETGTSEPSWGAKLLGYSKPSWFIDFGNWLRQVATHYNIVMVGYFDYDKTEINGNDWSIATSWDSQEAFRKATKGL